MSVPKGTLRVTVCSDVGHVRQSNEDSICVDQWVASRLSRVEAEFDLSNEGSHCLAVADGIGGHSGGAEASSIVVKTFSKCCLRSPFKTSIEAAINDCEKALRSRMIEDPTLRRMGSTISGVILHEGDFYYFNVGDSRVYLHDGTRLEQLSIDDVRPSSGTLTQSIGGTPGVIPQSLMIHTGMRKLEKGWKILICSDGLTDMVSDETIKRALNSSTNSLAKDLVERALQRGGIDNTSVLLVSYSS
jgi:protein phosphatase